MSRVDFLVDSNGCKKLTLEFEPTGGLTFWNDERASRLVTKAPNDPWQSLEGSVNVGSVSGSAHEGVPTTLVATTEYHPSR